MYNKINHLQLPKAALVFFLLLYLKWVDASSIYSYWLEYVKFIGTENETSHSVSKESIDEFNILRR